MITNKECSPEIIATNLTATIEALNSQASVQDFLSFFIIVGFVAVCVIMYGVDKLLKLAYQIELSAIQRELNANRTETKQDYK